MVDAPVCETGQLGSIPNRVPPCAVVQRIRTLVYEAWNEGSIPSSATNFLILCCSSLEVLQERISVFEAWNEGSTPSSTTNFLTLRCSSTEEYPVSTRLVRVRVLPAQPIFWYCAVVHQKFYKKEFLSSKQKMKVRLLPAQPIFLTLRCSSTEEYPVSTWLVRVRVLPAQLQYYFVFKTYNVSYVL